MLIELRERAENYHVQKQELKRKYDLTEETDTDVAFSSAYYLSKSEKLNYKELQKNDDDDYKKQDEDENDENYYDNNDELFDDLDK